MKYSSEYLITSIKRGDKRSASLVMSLIENGSPKGEECLRGLGIKTERSYVLGITGWPGVGKSTLGGCPRIQYAIL
jgi:LAO/AO transport system kinase